MSCRLIWVTPEAEKVIGYCARVSNPANQDNPEVSKLLAYCVKNKHWSVFEMANMCVEIETTIPISAQILRHKSANFQQFCLTGDAEVYFDLPFSKKIGRPALFKMKISDLYEKWNKNSVPGREWNLGRYKKMKIRTFDVDNNILTHTHIKEVFYTGEQECFEVKLEDGKTIKCTKDEKFFVESKGWVTLGEMEGNLPQVAVGVSDKKVKFVKVVEVKSVGLQKTYDLEVENACHNFVANGIVVHNSARYQKVQGFEPVTPRRQDVKNRQNSIDDLPDETKVWFEQGIKEIQDKANEFYNQALEKGVAKECARFALPQSASTRMYMNASIRTWIHYIELRTGHGTQQEHKEIAEEIKTIFVQNLPAVAEALGWTKAG